MDYEKKYKEALKRAKDFMSVRGVSPDENAFECAKELSETISPELAESEDVKIKSDIQYAVRCAYGDNSEQTNKIFAWVEKQGKNNMGISEATKQKLLDNLNKALEKETPKSYNEFLEKQGKKDILDDAVVDSNEDGLIADTIKQKPVEWSEEEESLIENICTALKGYALHERRVDLDEHAHRLEEMAVKLKSLRPQKQWKPSEEMLEALYRAVPQNVKEISEDEILLDKLYQGLKYGRVISNN